LGCSSCCSSPGIGNGSTFRTIGVIFDAAGRPGAGLDLVAAYGAFVAPIVIGDVKAGTPQFAM
jgi:NNP family nitrate/nitrite transporter-like MFS transporter